MSTSSPAGKSGNSTDSSELKALRGRLPELMLHDQHQLRRRIDSVSGRGGVRNEKLIAEITTAVQAAEVRLRDRRQSLPSITFPEELPVSRHRQDIARAIAEHQVVVIAGETGSGKTTQIPKICLELGLGVRGQIAHTQPRRLAARTVAERIASELKTDLGAAVGYKIRFTDRSSDRTYVKLMTDGILLAEIQTDRLLRRYDTIIIDEAHERSLNIDFILGYLKQILPRRPDLKIIVTSATIDPERFSQHFTIAGKAAPVIEVSGRTYPVEVRYRPIIDLSEGEDSPVAASGIDKDRDQTQAICDAVNELSAEPSGDILVFLSGEREIRDTADALNQLDLRNTEVLPLYARLSSQDQYRVFQPHTGRRIVLATNVAETSLTVPGIKYVIDPGTARISRYSHRTKVQRLPIEGISQASANQRKGRCGRTSDGICIRLYAEDDFTSRPEFTDPEILRTNLASVILQMTSWGLGDISAFPFVQPPDRRQVTDGVNLLRELGAIGDAGTTGTHGVLTPIGRKLAQLPIDPRLGRMVLEAGRNGCAHEVMIIVAALSIQDPRERPAEKQQAADEKHGRFTDKTSDFLTYLNLWEYLRRQRKALSGGQFRRMCRAEFLNYLRVREWQDIYSQLRQLSKSLDVVVTEPPVAAAIDDETSPERESVSLSGVDFQRLHTSLIAGLLSHIGLKDPLAKEQSAGDYLGARGTRFSLFPGSALFKKQPRWVMSAELVETARLWGRVNAKIEPDWVEPLAAHLIKRSYSEPHWERRQGAVMAMEKVTLYGVTLAAGRRVNYGRVDPELSRELFIRCALVEGDWQTQHQFFRENRALLDEIEDLENRARRRDILVDDQTLFDFYDQRIGADVVSSRHFDTWWKKARRDNAELLNFEKSMLINESAGDVDETSYPDSWVQGALSFPLTYQFEPGADADGVTVHIPLAVLNQVRDEGFDWQVPGLREELITVLIKSLPKPIRRNFVPAPDHAKLVLSLLESSGELSAASFVDTIAGELEALRDVSIPADAWDFPSVPEHLKITFRVVDDNGKKLAEGKNLPALQRELSSQVRRTISSVAESIEKKGLTSPDFGVLPQVFHGHRGGNEIKAYPALTDEGDVVSVRMMDTAQQQHYAMWRGTRKMLRLALPSPIKFINRSLTNQSKLVLNRNPHGSVAALLEDCVNCAVDALMMDSGGPVWSEQEFAPLLEKVRSRFNSTVFDVVNEVEKVLLARQQAEVALADANGPAESLADIRHQLGALVYPGFITETGFTQLRQVSRYLHGIERR